MIMNFRESLKRNISFLFLAAKDPIDLNMCKG